MKLTKLLVKPGSIGVNVDCAHVRIKHSDIAAIEIDLKSKRAEIGTYYSDDYPIVELEARPETLAKTKRKNDTVITFKDFKGWSVFNATVTKYTLRVTLYK